MHSCPETTQTRHDLIFVLEQAELFVAFKHQVLQRLVRDAKLSRHVHGKLLGVEVFYPPPPGDTNLSVLEKLNVGRRVDLQRRDQQLVYVFRLDAQRRQRLTGRSLSSRASFPRSPKPLLQRSFSSVKVGRRARC